LTGGEEEMSMRSVKEGMSMMTGGEEGMWIMTGGEEGMSIMTGGEEVMVSMVLLSRLFIRIVDVGSRYR
jgi:hypothetical protein